MKGIGSIRFLLGLLLIGSVNAAEYELTGTIHKSSPQFQKFSQVYSFRVSVSGERWNIRLLPVSYTPDQDGFTPITPDYLEAGSDGTNFFEVTSIESYAATAKPRLGVRNSSAFATQGPEESRLESILRSQGCGGPMLHIYISKRRRTGALWYQTAHFRCVWREFT